MIEQALRSTLIADPDLSALVGQRVYPLTLPQGVTFPALTYQVIFGVHPVVHDGPQGLAQVRVQFDCWGERYADVVAVAQALKALLNGYKGPMGEITEVVARLAGEVDGWESEVRAFNKTVDFQVWYVEG